MGNWSIIASLFRLPQGVLTHWSSDARFHALLALQDRFHNQQMLAVCETSLTECLMDRFRLLPGGFGDLANPRASSICLALLVSLGCLPRSVSHPDAHRGMILHLSSRADHETRDEDGTIKPNFAQLQVQVILPAE